MIARAAADLACDASLLHWQPLGEEAYVAHGCDKQVKYVRRCHQEFENPARPTYPPIDVCEWSLDGVRPDPPPPPLPPPPLPPLPPPDGGDASPPR